jgi:hypothetical protein
MWLPEFDSESDFDLESGLYEYANTARLKGSNRAFDSIMVDAFSKAYSDIIDEVKRKEPPVEKQNYDVPGLNLYSVTSQICAKKAKIFQRGCISPCIHKGFM